VDPPLFVQLVGHPVRWQLLQELVHSDRRVRELTELLDERQSLVSYHLGQLRDGGIVRTHRSAADRRDAYYSIDLSSCGAQLQSAAVALHPGLRFVPAVRTRQPARRRRKVLFLCTGNSARSQMAEALLVQMSQGTIIAASAGSNPKPLHPNAVRVMAERGIDISKNKTKHLDGLVSQRFERVITLCDKVREVCPEFPSLAPPAHWSIPDPAVEGSTPRASYPAFVRTADELEERIGYLLEVLE
jgi:protein-tyrosine-phosphatase/DNA-binding transcriptional ArsR family regulator